jgi:ATP adenylyltransferase
VALQNVADVDLGAGQFYNRTMDNLWAPWRIRYILGEKEPGCFFCRKSQEADDGKNHILIRDRTCFALLNTYPYNAGHLMVAPYKHTGDLDDLAEQELAAMSALIVRCKQLLTRAIKPQGFNIGLNLGRCAGAGVLDHVHWHIVPRWDGDTNFMPVLADVRVVPQALDELFATLKKSL